MDPVYFYLFNSYVKYHQKEIEKMKLEKQKYLKIDQQD